MRAISTIVFCVLLVLCVTDAVQLVRRLQETASLGQAPRARFSAKPFQSLKMDKAKPSAIDNADYKKKFEKEWWYNGKEKDVTLPKPDLIEGLVSKDVKLPSNIDALKKGVALVQAAFKKFTKGGQYNDAVKKLAGKAQVTLGIDVKTMKVVVNLFGQVDAKTAIPGLTPDFDVRVKDAKVVQAENENIYNLNVGGAIFIELADGLYRGSVGACLRRKNMLNVWRNDGALGSLHGKGKAGATAYGPTGGNTVDSCGTWRDVVDTDNPPADYGRAELNFIWSCTCSGHTSGTTGWGSADVLMNALPVGAQAMEIRGDSSGVVHGTIDATDFLTVGQTFTRDDRTYDGLLVATARTAGGDSGGAWIYGGRIIGIHKGSASGRAFATPIWNINIGANYEIC